MAFFVFYNFLLLFLLFNHIYFVILCWKINKLIIYNEETERQYINCRAAERGISWKGRPLSGMFHRWLSASAGKAPSSMMESRKNGIGSCLMSESITISRVRHIRVALNVIRNMVSQTGSTSFLQNRANYRGDHVGSRFSCNLHWLHSGFGNLWGNRNMLTWCLNHQEQPPG